MGLEFGVWSAESEWRVFAEELGNEEIGWCVVGHVFGELEIGGEDLLVDLEWIFSILSKGHIASKKLIQDDAKGP